MLICASRDWIRVEIRNRPTPFFKSDFVMRIVSSPPWSTQGTGHVKGFFTSPGDGALVGRDQRVVEPLHCDATLPHVVELPDTGLARTEACHDQVRGISLSIAERGAKRGLKCNVGEDDMGKRWQLTLRKRLSTLCLLQCAVVGSGHNFFLS